MAIQDTGIGFRSVVGTVLGTTATNEGVLCTHPNVNMWSKKKPQIDTRVVKNEALYWRRSNVSDNIRSGLFIPNQVEGLWEYPRTSSDCPYRIGDFRGYEHTSSLEYYLNFNNELRLDLPYTAGIVFNGYDSQLGADDVGKIGLQDLFDLENKYCCIKVELSRTGEYIEKYSDRIVHDRNSPIFGAEITFSESQVNVITGGGDIDMKIFFIEADEMIAEELQGISKFSLKATDAYETKHINRQYKSSGFIVYSNFDTQQPTRNARIVSSSGYEQIVVASPNRTGGSFSGYYFQARILGGNQMGQNHLYQLPSHTLVANDSEMMTIPSFTIELLIAETSQLEYSVWDGNPETTGSEMILSHTFNL